MEKIKVFLVDDEYLERTLLRYSVPWEELGLEIVGEAESGEEMMEKIKSASPDIIFTDICMPFMDGLQMSKIVKEQYSDIEVVIITGHRDFSYAKNAIHIGVSEYLLKPIDKQEVIDISQKIKNRIKNRKEMNLQYQLIHDIQNSGISLTADKKCSELVTHAIKIIEDSLSNSELSLKSIAQDLYVNPSYLCRVFKREARENITDYILQLRIKRSIEYLKNTNLKAYEIAEKVGISDSHYFSILFKKQVGKSIQEYKKQYFVSA